MTMRTVENPDEARLIVAYYRRRWVIEQVFRVMKTKGFDIEAVPVRENAPLANLGCATLIAAIHIQQMVHDRDGLAARPMTDVFEPADQPVIEAIGRTHRASAQPSPFQLAGPRDMDLRPSGRMDRLLWKARANRLGERTSTIAHHARRHKTFRTCANRVGPGRTIALTIALMQIVRPGRTMTNKRRCYYIYAATLAPVGLDPVIWRGTVLEQITGSSPMMT